MTDAPQTPSSEPPAGDSGNPRNMWLVLAIALGVVVLAVILFLILRPDDSEPAAATSSEAEPTTTVETTTEETTTEETTTEETTTEETTTEETTTTTPADQPQTIRVRYQNGEVVGGIVEAEVKQDTRVVLAVRADVTDEVHLHGYNLFTNVAPGQVGRITFTADKTGVFEAELEDLGVPIAELTVSP